jgi:photosystem II stability/assembly factor-like uncharacterized protein
MLAAGGVCALFAQNPDPSLYQEMRWRMIGPHRGGRTVGAAGVPGMPNVFYIGVNNGGVWKTGDYGRTWRPLFDDQPTGSIGTLAVAPSDPAVIYVGSGEGLQRPDLSTGDGIYKSTDAGNTWRHLGLRDGEQICSIIVDPLDPDRLFVAVLGHPYGPNEERGVFRSTDGGKTFQRVLFRDENTGGVALAFDPADAQTVYASLWSARQGPWENGQWEGPGSGLYKSTDGGSTWRRLEEGLPAFAQGLGRIGFCVAPSRPDRIYAIVAAIPEHGGLFRSDDRGEHWRRINGDGRLWGRGDDFAEVKVDPKDPDIVWCANIVTWRSSDGGATFTGIKGAPGGDDYHSIWINPGNPQIMLIAGDQGATISVNGGETWSSWYNQPTAQFYHVITDNQFPYRVYGGQQESGSVGIVSRGNDGGITFREWHPVGVDEYGYVAPDPLNPRMIYGGRITVTDMTTGQIRNISPAVVRTGNYRVLRTAPVLFSPVDPHTLYYAMNVLFKTTNGGEEWEVISPDLSRERPAVPPSVGVFASASLESQPRRGVIYTVAPSPRDINVVWAGTDDGLIHVTRDGGKAWADVTPAGLTSWSKISLIDASHFGTKTAYAAVNRFRCDDLHPYIYRTRNWGGRWELIVKGLPEDAPVNAVREDPEREGLLFCGTERAVYFSLNDGDSWEPLRLNMPATSIRDVVVHDDDLVVATHGRSFWILDDITPLRQINPRVAESDVTLFRPEMACRVRWDTNTDTPLPPEEPAGENPPDGAIIDYVLRSSPAQPLALEIRDSTGALVRRFSGADRPDSMNAAGLNIPLYWIRPFRPLSSAPGMRRFVWDLHYPPPGANRAEYPMSAVYHDTPRHPLGPWVLPGRYTVNLIVDGRTYSQPLTVSMDPRVSTSSAGLTVQFTYSMRVYEGVNTARSVLSQIGIIRSNIREIRKAVLPGSLGDSLAALDLRMGALEGMGVSGRRFRVPSTGPAGPTLRRAEAELRLLLDILQEADDPPTSRVVESSVAVQNDLMELLARWQALRKNEIASINKQLQASHLPSLTRE